jgi:hypothetical protein
MTNTDKPGKPNYCKRCGRDHAVDALIQEHLDELFDDDKPPANQGDELDDLRFDLRLTERQLEELEAGKTYYLPLTDTLRVAVLSLHQRQLTERLQMVLDKLPTEWTPREGIATNRSLGALGYNYALREVRNIIRDLMPKEA